MNIQSLPTNAASPLAQQVGQTPKNSEFQKTFGSVFNDLVGEVDQSQHQVDVEVDRMLTGESSNMHDVSLAVAKADLSFRFMMEVRDKLIGAFREVMRMQV